MYLRTHPYSTYTLHTPYFCGFWSNTEQQSNICLPTLPATSLYFITLHLFFWETFASALILRARTRRSALFNTLKFTTPRLALPWQTSMLRCCTVSRLARWKAKLLPCSFAALLFLNLPALFAFLLAASSSSCASFVSIYFVHSFGSLAYTLALWTSLFSWSSALAVHCLVLVRTCMYECICGVYIQVYVVLMYA